MCIRDSCFQLLTAESDIQPAITPIAASAALWDLRRGICYGATWFFRIVIINRASCFIRWFLVIRRWRLFFLCCKSISSGTQCISSDLVGTLIAVPVSALFLDWWKQNTPYMSRRTTAIAAALSVLALGSPLITACANPLADNSFNSGVDKYNQGDYQGAIAD